MRVPLYGKPEKFFITSAIGIGETELTAFDDALLKARVGNYNLLKVSSIVPADAIQVREIDLKPGSLLPIAYGFAVSAESGIRVTAAVAVAFPEKGEVGVIMEYSGNLVPEEAERIVRMMAEEAIRNRGSKVARLLVKSASSIVKEPHWTCAFAGVAVW